MAGRPAGRKGIDGPARGRVSAFHNVSGISARYAENIVALASLDSTDAAESERHLPLLDQSIRFS
jgi:hypothetical protein